MSVIAVDLDGVVFDFCGQFANYLNLRHGKPMEEMPRPTVWWDFWDQWGMNRDTFYTLFREFGETGGFAIGEPFAHAIESLHKLDHAGHHIRIVTARGCERVSGTVYRRTVKSSTLDWLYRHNVPYTDLYFTNHKADVVADVFLDDAFHHLDAIRAAGKRGVAFDALYNKQWDGERVGDWAEFYHLITKPKCQRIEIDGNTEYIEIQEENTCEAA